MSGQDLYKQLNVYKGLLKKAQSELKQRGYDLASAEEEYEIAKGKEAAIQHDQGTHASIINKIIDGNVAPLKKKMKMAKVAYETCDKAIDTFKKQGEWIENQIKREWKG